MTSTKAVRIADFCKTGSGGTPSRSQTERYYEGGIIPWIKSGELREAVINNAAEYVTEAALKESSIKLVPAGAILLAMYGATVGRLGILGIEATTNQAVCHIIPDPDVADTRYIFHAISSRVPDLIAMGVGGAQPNISQTIIKDLAIPLPTIPEQIRIAAILDQADALRVKRRNTLVQLDGLTQAIFIEMFGEPATNPKGWRTKQLAELIVDGDTINYGVVQPGDDVDDGIPLVRVGDLINGRICNATLKKISPSIESAYKRSRLHGDEILVSCVGSVGVVALANTSVRGFNIARAVARIRLSDMANREFIAAHLRTDSVQRYFTKELRTVSQPTLNIKQLSETVVMCPPIEMQLEFATRCFKVGEMKLVYDKSRIEFDNLFASIQHCTFRSEL